MTLNNHNFINFLKENFTYSKIKEQKDYFEIVLTSNKKKIFNKIKQFFKYNEKFNLLDFQFKKNFILINLVYYDEFNEFFIQKFKIFYKNNYLSLFENKIIKNKNLIIFFYGCDGVGKSYLIKNFHEELRKNKITCSLFHYPIRKNTKINESNPYNKKTYNIFLSLLKINYLIFKNFFYLFNKKFFNRKEIILIDRGPIDLIIDPQRSRVLENSILKKISTNLIKIFNLSSLDILLISEPRLIFLRKKELTLNQIINNQNKYVAYFKKNPHSVTINVENKILLQIIFKCINDNNLKNF